MGVVFFLGVVAFLGAAAFLAAGSFFVVVPAAFLAAAGLALVTRPDLVLLSTSASPLGLSAVLRGLLALALGLAALVVFFSVFSFLGRPAPAAFLGAAGFFSVFSFYKLR